MEPPSARHAASHARTGGCLSRGTITSALREALSQRQEVVAAYLFGSYATGRERPDSDVDVAVLLDTETPHCDDPLYRLDLIASLAERLHCSVDVVILNDAPLVLRHQVLTYGERILETDRAQRVAYEVRSFQLYFDFRPILDTIAEATRRHIREGTFGQGRLRPVIGIRLAMLSEHVNDLRALKSTTYEEYLENRILRGYVERTLQVCAQICLDVGGHLIAEMGFRPPADSHDVFSVLNEEGIVRDALRTDLARMVGFRNLIVHDYARIDDALVYAVLQDHLDDFAQFAAAVTAFVDSLG